MNDHEWSEPLPGDWSIYRTVTGHRPPRITGSVIDAGGGEITILLDRDTQCYMTKGTRVAVEELT